MKKIYLTPETWVSLIDTQLIMVGSQTLLRDNLNEGLEQDLRDDLTTDATSGNLVGGTSLWDEEE